MRIIYDGEKRRLNVLANNSFDSVELSNVPMMMGDVIEVRYFQDCADHQIFFVLFFQAHCAKEVAFYCFLSPSVPDYQESLEALKEFQTAAYTNAAVPSFARVTYLGPHSDDTKNDEVNSASKDGLTFQL